METKELIETLTHFYEVDIDNCKMTNETWIEQLAEALTNPEYLNELMQDYNEYLNDRK
jgi:uncharacterized protein YsxB (DUF464 family)